MFVVFEGIDGAGTSTQAALLAEYLNKKGWETLSTCEPSQGPIGTLIRGMLAREAAELSNKAFALLFSADRQHHYERVIAPFLYSSSQGRKEKHAVIADRYSFSTCAYQGYGDEETVKWIESINSYVGSPDITIFLDVDPKVAIARLKKNRPHLDYFEEEKFLEEVRNDYKEVFWNAFGTGKGAFKGNFYTLDGSQPIAAVAKEVEAIVEKSIFSINNKESAR